MVYGMVQGTYVLYKINPSVLVRLCDFYFMDPVFTVKSTGSRDGSTDECAGPNNNNDKIKSDEDNEDGFVKFLLVFLCVFLFSLLFLRTSLVAVEYHESHDDNDRSRGDCGEAAPSAMCGRCRQVFYCHVE